MLPASGAMAAAHRITRSWRVVRVLQLGGLLLLALALHYNFSAESSTSFFDKPDNNFVGDELASIHEFLGLEPVWCLARHCISQNISG